MHRSLDPASPIEFLPRPPPNESHGRSTPAGTTGARLRGARARGASPRAAPVAGRAGSSTLAGCRPGRAAALHLRLIPSLQSSRRKRLAGLVIALETDAGDAREAIATRPE